MTSKNNLRCLFSWGIAVALLIALPVQVMADPLSDSRSAYDAGDYAKAAHLLKPLATHGDAVAQFNLAFMYAQGQGFDRNYVLAYMWADIAASDTDDSEYRKQYAGLRDSVAKKMTTDQIAKAKKLEHKCLTSRFKGC